MSASPMCMEHAGRYATEARRVIKMLGVQVRAWGVSIKPRTGHDDCVVEDCDQRATHTLLVDGVMSNGEKITLFGGDDDAQTDTNQPASCPSAQAGPDAAQSVNAGGCDDRDRVAPPI